MGRIRRAHGLAGTVVVEVETDRPADRFAVGSELVLDDGSPLTVAAFQATERLPLVTFAEISDRAGAEALRGAGLHIQPERRRRLEPDEFWPEDLEGCEVVDVSGAPLGRVVGVDLGAGQHRLRVEGAGVTLIIPFVAALITEVDLESRRLVAELPPGFTD